MKTRNFLNGIGCFLWAVLITACSSDDPAPYPEGANVFDPVYMMSSELGQQNGHLTGFIMPGEDYGYLLEYKGGRPVKITGGVIPVAQTSGYRGFFTHLLYKEVSYQGDQISIEEKVEPNDYLAESAYGKCILYLKSGKVIKRINENQKYTEFDNDTLYYEYDNRGVLNKVILQGRYEKVINEVTFDMDGNLSQIAYKEYRTDNNDLLREGYHEFGDYDAAPNLFKPLGIFTGLYYRSLSNNNFRSYVHRNATNDVISFMNWKINYDSAGKPIYGDIELGE